MNDQSSRRTMRPLAALTAVMLIGVALYASRTTVGPVSAGDEKTANAVAKANAFLETLNPKQKDAVLLEYGSVKKPSWSNLPVTMVARNGVRLGELNKAQREAGLALLASTLSKEGYQKCIDIMRADETLVKGKENTMKFGTDNFYLAIFGKPSVEEPWMVQFGGHHLGINVTMQGKNAVVTPSHTGTQPDSFTRDGKVIRPLGVENDLAFKLVNMLDAKQSKEVILGSTPKNLILGPGLDGKQIKPEGIKGAALTVPQRDILMQLIGAWVNILPEEAAAKRLEEIKTKLDDTYFVWYGSKAKGGAAYFRIQGPTLVIEYAPQKDVSHIHTIIRDPTNEYGAKLVKAPE